MLEIIFNLIGDMIVQVLSRSPKVENKDNEIIFKFNKGLKLVMLICAIIFSIFLVLGGALIIIEKTFVLLYFLVFGGLLILSIYGYLVQKNKKIILKQNIFYVTNFLGQNSKYSFDEIIKAKLLLSDGVILYTWSNQKFKVDEQMSNYDLLIKKLLEKNIKIVNWYGKEIK